MEREEDGTYLISSAAQLDDFSRIVNEEDPSAKAKLVNGIVYNDSLFDEDGSFDAENKDSFRYFTPIGTSSDFKGTFDGNGRTIGGLYIYFAEAVAHNKPEANYLGLIAKGAGATVCDLTLQDSYICGCQYVGGICGSASENTKIENCRVLSSQINGVYNIGGICGNALYATIRRCQNSSAVYAKAQAAGGILGNVADKKVTVEYCLNTGTLSGEDAGEIVGKTDFDVTIRSCLSLGTLSATGYVGNILGYYRNSAFVIENCAYLYESGNSVGDGEVPAGEGTAESPYKIVNAGNLLWLSQYYNHTLKSGLVPDGKKTYAKMESDTRSIDMSTLGEHPFLPIGNAVERFSGVFDGNRNTLYNLKITEGETAGLFGETYDAQIKSLTIIGAAVSGSECAGTAVDYATGLNKFNTVLSEVRAWSCSVNGSRYVGGLVGRLSTGRMENCGTHSTRVNAAFYGGGLVGFSDDAVIANIYSFLASLNGTEKEGSAIGGLVGYNVGTVTDGYAYGATYSGASYSCGAVSGIGYSSKNCFYYAENTEKFWNDGTSKTVSAFQSGAVCYLLNGGVTDGTQVWYEEIGIDNTPQLYYTGDTDVKCAVYRNRNEYSNTPAAWVEINASTVTAHNLAACGYADGATLVLSIDGAFYVATIRDDSALALSSIGVNLAKETAVRALLWENLQKAKPIAEPYSTTVNP